MPRRHRRDAQLADGEAEEMSASADAGRAARRRRRPFREALARLAEDRARQFRRAGRADRPHAPRARGGEALDRREAVPACAELLHAAARPRGAAARDLCRLAAARRARRNRRGHTFRAPGLRGAARAQHRLSPLRTSAAGRGAVLRLKAAVLAIVPKP